MKNLLLSTLVSILAFSACKNDTKLNFPALITSPYDTIIQLNSKQMLLSEPIVYGANIKDSLDFSKEFDYDIYKEEAPFEIYEKTDSVLIYVDTSYNDFHSNEMNKLMVIPSPPPKPSDSIYEYDDDYFNNVEFKEQWLKREKEHYNTIPVYVYNFSNSNRIISKPIVNGELFLQVQAKDKNGVWKPIEYNYIPGFICGTGHQDYLLEPKHFIVSTIKKYSGDYKTKMRVKFMSLQKIYYSNEFDGSINYSQFDLVKEVIQMNKRYSDSNNKNFDYKKKLIFLDF
jgi:hypothetical protein